jgi:molecular chaperone DnaK (HSP70)
MKEIIIGIDLGTTNSEVAIVKDGQPIVIAEQNKKIIPSYVGLSDDGKILVGEPARNQFLIYPERTIKSIKRKMGSNETVKLGDKTYTPQEISAMILMKLKGMAERYLGREVKKAVITVPAYFSDAQRQATRDAGEIAGLEVVRIINEPTAAALAYETDHKEEKKILVYDLGGGTFDVSVVSLQAGVVEVLSGHGNNHLGGDDFDNKIAERIYDDFKSANELDLRSNPRSKARVIRASENAKIFLSDNPFVKIEEEYISEKKGLPLNLDIELARHDYEDLIRPYIDETLDAVHTALKGANLSASQIDEILLVGGSTRTPMISAMLKENFNKAPRKEIDPDLCVAIGAAIQAAMIAGESVSSVLVDITPYTFGTSALGMLHGVPSHDVYVPLIEKNTPIPVSKSDVFYTVVDNQEIVEIKVFQGENEDASKNITIGSFKIEGLSRVPNGNEIVATFDLDINGILKVSAVEKRTGLKKSIKIDNAIARFEEHKLIEAKEKIKSVYEAEFLPSAETSESVTVADANALIQKAQAMMNEIPEDDRDDVINLIEDIRDGIGKNDMESLDEAVEHLADILRYHES